MLLAPPYIIEEACIDAIDDRIFRHVPVRLVRRETHCIAVEDRHDFCPGLDVFCGVAKLLEAPIVVAPIAAKRGGVCRRYRQRCGQKRRFHPSLETKLGGRERDRPKYGGQAQIDTPAAQRPLGREDAGQREYDEDQSHARMYTNLSAPNAHRKKRD